MEGLVIGPCRICNQPFGIVVREGERIQQVCNPCKDAAAFKLEEKRVLDSIQVGYLSPHE